MTLSSRAQWRHSHCSHRWLLTMALCLGSMSAFAAAGARSPQQTVPHPQVPTPADPASMASKPSAVRPSPSMDARTRSAVAREPETLRGVIAASLVGALSEQLGGRPVKITLTHVDVQATSLRDRLVSGQGELQIDTSQDWIGFRFSLLYDAMLDSAGYPELSIGTVGPGGRAVPNDSRLVRELDDRVVDMLGKEFGYQQVRLQLDEIATLEAGAHYLRIDAIGIADFGIDGTAPARVEALYDREHDLWLRVAYRLDSGLPVLPALSPDVLPQAAQPVGGR